MAQHPVPKVEVELLSPTASKKHHNVTIKQIYQSLLRSKEQVTEDTEIYVAALNDQSASQQTNKDNAQPSKTPKYLVQNMALVGNALIAKPDAPNFTWFPAKLDVLSKSSLSTIITDSGSGQKIINGKVLVFPAGGSKVEGIFDRWTPVTESSLSVQSVDTSTDTDTETTVSDVDNFQETGSPREIYATSSNNAIPKITSTFDIAVNQPFALKLWFLNSLNDEQIAQIKLIQKASQETTNTTSNNSSDSTTSSSTTATKDKEKKLIPWVDISWGGLVLSVFADSRVSLTANGQIIKDRVTLPSTQKTDKEFLGEVYIYPLGNALYVYSELPTTESTINRKYAVFTFKESIVIPGGKILITFNTKSGKFNYSPILHPSSGLFQSPTIKLVGNTDSPIVNTFHLGKIGVGARGDEPSIPDSGDKQGLYTYLKDGIGDKPIQIKKASGGGGFAYQLLLNVKKDTLKFLEEQGPEGNPQDTIVQMQKNIYSPAIFSTHFTFKQSPQTTSGGSYEFDSSDILNVTVNQSVETQRATVVINNRRLDGSKGGKYPRGSIFTGIKPIQIRMGYGDSSVQTVFTGYTSVWSWQRQGSTKSTITIQCEDASKKAREQFAVNLPFFDGWCHNGAMKYLMNEAGYSDSDVSMPATTGNIDSFEGGCFDGHADAPPSDDYEHASLPLAILGVSEPNYNFAMGTPLWQCMQRIREFVNFYLFANHNGVIVYNSPKNVLSAATNKIFREVDKVGDFNEIHQGIEITLDTAELRNGVYLQGNTFVANIQHPELSQWSTHVHIKNSFPSEQKPTDPFYAPYSRLAFLRNPKFEDVNLARAGAIEIFRRLTRDRTTITFNGWGQLDLHPYDLITINESVMNETGSGAGQSYIIAAHTLVADAGSHTIMSTFNCEVLDTGTANYDPSLPPQFRE